MDVSELLSRLKDILKVNPEAKSAQVWSRDNNLGSNTHISYIGYDKKHKPNRIILED